MHILCFAVISHERPQLLAHMLDSLRNTVISSQIQVIVCDNSVHSADDIASLCSCYDFVELICSPGCSQADNYLQALANCSAQFISFLHDDDFLYLNKKMLLHTISKLQSSENNQLFYPNNFSFSPSSPYFLSSFKSSLPRPLSLGAFPFSLPVFPCWVYPVIPELPSLIHQNVVLRPFGKYSDISLIEDILDLLDYKVSALPYYYFHVQHSGSDSCCKQDQ